VRAQRPSVTARSVALVRSRLVRSSSPSGDPEAEDQLYGGLRPVLWPLRGRRHERIAARTRFFDDETLRAIADGVTQVVIVGAGYDGRALRFRSPGVRFFELDHPATQADKQQRVHGLGLAADDVVYVPLDLTQDQVDTVLAAAGHNRNDATLFICEGLLLYLPKVTVADLFGRLRSCARSGSRLVLSTRERPRSNSTSDRVREVAGRTVLALIGEPRRSRFEPGEIGRLLEDARWTVARRVRRDSSRAREVGEGGLLLVVEPIEHSTPRA
jgi:methyltransferase (TIGR00027 family)